MEIFFRIGLVLLWVLALGGCVSLILTRFEYDDLNILVFVLVIFAVLNTFLLKKK